MKKMKETGGILLLIIMLFISLTACNSKKTEDATTTQDQEATQTADQEKTEDDKEEDGKSEEDSSDTTTKESGDGTSIPRQETLYMSGLQWGAINDMNPLSANSNNALVIDQADQARTTVWETLFMYNQLDGKLYPLLATEYEQKDNVFTIAMNTDAKWSDGKPVTAKDVAYTFNIHKDMATNHASMWDYIASVEATDDATVVITADTANYNPLKVLEVLPKLYILPEHQISELVKKHNGDPDKVKTDKNEDYIGSGPYELFYSDETKVVLVRNDNYWGQSDSMWGQLPVPKYLAHNIYADNNSSSVAFQQGEVDVTQAFTPEIWKMWEEQDLPVSTYIDEPPYYLSGSLPTAIFNTTKPGLDHAVVRKAIAMATDYDQIAKTAMSGYTPLMKDVPPSMMNPTAAEQSLLDKAALAPLQWSGKQIEEAKKLLDEAGIVDTNGDGIREADGTELVFTVECPAGWTDWNASLEMVAAAGQEIGMDITTYFPEAPVWTEDLQTGNFDIIMNTYAGASIANPWTRIYQTLYSDGGTTAGNDRVYYNYSRYINERADEIIDAIPKTTDKNKLIELYTEINQIYLNEVPCFALMYRPVFFHTVNETVWTSYPEYEDGTNIPPSILISGYGIAGLYNLELVE